MDGKTRRQRILEMLDTEFGITGSEIAARFGVSRQVIVGDVAILRAAGHPIKATPQGYLLNTRIAQHTAALVCRHDADGLREELMTIVECGGKVLDVRVEHSIYGELRGELLLSTAADVERFLELAAGSNAVPLSQLTSGIHLHTIEAPNAQILKRIEETLRAKHLLYEA